MEVEEFLSGRIFHFVSFHLEDLGWVVWVLLSPSSSLPLPLHSPSQSLGAMWLCPMQLRGCGGGGLGAGLRILEVVVVVVVPSGPVVILSVRRRCDGVVMRL
jgi:hypothetical protein